MINDVIDPCTDIIVYSLNPGIHLVTNYIVRCSQQVIESFSHDQNVVKNRAALKLLGLENVLESLVSMQPVCDSRAQLILCIHHLLSVNVLSTKWHFLRIILQAGQLKKLNDMLILTGARCADFVQANNRHSILLLIATTAIDRPPKLALLKLRLRTYRAIPLIFLIPLL